MRPPLAVLAFLLLATAASAAEPPRREPVFITRESMDAAAREIVLHPRPVLHWDFGDVVYESRYGRARFNYLPALRTLPYTFPSKDWNQIPDPFVLNGVR